MQNIPNIYSNIYSNMFKYIQVYPRHAKTNKNMQDTKRGRRPAGAGPDPVRSAGRFPGRWARPAAWYFVYLCIYVYYICNFLFTFGILLV